MVLLGVAFAPEAPLRIIYVFPGSPAKQAGLRRGQTVIAINGTSVAGRTVDGARALIDRREGAPNTIQVRNPSGRVEEITLAPALYRVPALESEVLPGNIGLIRFYEFRSSASQTRLLREALEDFEAQGVGAWIIDLRENSGGFAHTMTAMISLFVPDGRLFGTITRGEPPAYTDATGAVLPFQRPLAFLVGPGSASAAEIMAGTLQAHGRALVVGGRTAGCVGSSRAGNGLLDGSALNVTRGEIVVGPDDRHYNRVGLTPDVSASPPTIEDEEAGYDPQLAAAMTALVQQPSGMR
jgi:carboxyl-terminal processing protease